MIKFLERGADISIRNNYGDTAIHYGILRSNDLYVCLRRAEIMQERQLPYDSEFPIDMSYSGIQYCQQQCSLHPEDFFLRQQWGNMYRMEGNYTEASETFDASVELDPDNCAVARMEDIRHYRGICDNCQKALIGRRYRCIPCEDFDLCQDCFELIQHLPDSLHEFIKIPSDKWEVKMIKSRKFNNWESK